MRRLALVALLVASTRQARAQSDAAVAREQLKLGADLRRAGKCVEAIPHFLESQRLDAQSRTLINLADCEERTAHLVAAQKHWVDARDRAALERNETIRAEAEARLEALDRRLPRLTLRLAPSAPPGSQVMRDGVQLGPISLGVPLPVDPGRHTIVVRAGGRADGTTDVTCVEAGSCAATVDAGPPLPERPPSPPATGATGATGPASTAPTPGGKGASSVSTGGVSSRTVALAVAGLGLVGLGVGSAFGLSAKSKWSDAQTNHCKGQGCDPIGIGLATEAKTASTTATLFFVGGAAFLGVGIMLYVAAPRDGSPPRSALRVAPSVGPGQAGVSLTGGFQ